MFANCNNVTRSDYVLVNEDDYHPALAISIRSKQPKLRPLNNKFNDVNLGWSFGCSDSYEKLLELLSLADWKRVYECVGVNLALNSFYNTLYDVFDKCFPKITIRTKSRVYPKWFSKEIINILIRKYFAHKSWKRTKKLPS